MRSHSIRQRLSAATPRARVPATTLLAVAAAVALHAPFACAEPAPEARAAPAVAAASDVATDVRVERVRPKREKHPTLRFLKENRDFIRARFDLLREKPDDHSGSAAAIDPRFLSYQHMLREILSARDSLAVAEDLRQRRDLFQSVTALGELEKELDLMENLLAAQRGRLGVMQADFTGRQQTALAIVVSGYPGDGALATLTITLDDGAPISIALSDEQRESLRRGGMLELFHGLVEPREQVLSIAIGGEGWPADDAGFVTLDPARDRLTFLRMDLTPAHAAQGAASMRASTWLQDTALDGSMVRASDGTPIRP
jgi:hypothetical protein